MWTAGADDRISGWSRGAEQLLGYASEEVMGERVDRLIAKRGSRSDEAGGAGRRPPIAETEAWLRRRDKTEINARLKERSFRDIDGQLRGTCTVVHGWSDARPQKSHATASPEVKARRNGGAGDWEAVRTNGTCCPLASSSMIGQSPKLLSAIKTALQVADSDATVLICGESGTGKELLARTIHSNSHRKTGALVEVNCAAFPEGLLESELFGHEKGAFTGALQRHKGRFERATGGTLLLDEIADMSLSLQAKILRALEQGEIERVGGQAGVPVDVRVVAATNRILTKDIAEGLFRQDLYYRLAVIVICLPPLRERGDDIRLLAEHFLNECATKRGGRVPRLSDETLALFATYGWPGNVRELLNVIQRAVLLAESDVIRPEHLPPELLNGPSADSLGTAECDLLTLAEIEKRHIQRVMATSGSLNSAAEILGVHRNTLRRKLKEYGQEQPAESVAEDIDTAFAPLRDAISALQGLSAFSSTAS